MVEKITTLSQGNTSRLIDAESNTEDTMDETERKK